MIPSNPVPFWHRLATDKPSNHHYEDAEAVEVERPLMCLERVGNQAWCVMNKHHEGECTPGGQPTYGPVRDPEKKFTMGKGSWGWEPGTKK